MDDPRQYARRYVNLAAPEHGAAVVSVTDDFFAPARRMLSPGAPRFFPDRYDSNGKWMDGWESRRRRDGGHDACVLRIRAGVVRAVEIDTRHFTGNFAPYASLEACRVAADPDAMTDWRVILPRTGLSGDCARVFEIHDGGTWTHLRLNIYPDGGIARLRVYGEPARPVGQGAENRLLDLAGEPLGGRALQCNNMHFGDMRNLLSARPVANMGDGWETRRRREPGNDWVVLQLGRKGRIARVEVDTAYFKGNHPARCSLRGGDPGTEEDLAELSAGWPVILPELALGPDQLHVFECQVRDIGEITHVRFDIYPDGGVARLRLLGIPAAGGAPAS